MNLSRPLRVPRVAELLDCSVRQVQRMLERGERGVPPPRGLRGYRVGTDWRVTPEAVAEYREASAKRGV